MIGFTLTEMLAAADTPTEDEPEKIALSKIPGPPIVGMKPMSEWQPIETAPKDGTEVLIWCGFRTVAIWNGNEWSDGSGLYLTPTKWIPLPDEPSAPES